MWGLGFPSSWLRAETVTQDLDLLTGGRRRHCLWLSVGPLTCVEEAQMQLENHRGGRDIGCGHLNVSVPLMETCLCNEVVCLLEVIGKHM